MAVGYPTAAARAVDAFGSRAVGATLLGVGVLSFVLTVRRARGQAVRAASGVESGAAGLSVWLRGLPLALPGLALATGDIRFLQLVPAVIEGVLCGLFVGSLRGGSSILEQAARTLEPFAPDFIGPYCRKATGVFAALFALQAAALCALALGTPGPDWARHASSWVIAPTVACTAIEFLVRKVWFRNYGPMPWDRLLRMLFPPEKTAQGRRSLEWIRHKRAELGLPPP